MENADECCRQNLARAYILGAVTRCASSAGSNSPLDEELGLLPGPLTPALAEQIAYMGTLLPFPAARGLTERCFRVALSEPTVRRRTYAAGEAAEASEAAFVKKLEKSLERSPVKGPPRQQVSADGAMVRMKGGEWKEVRSLVIGTVSAGKDGPQVSEQSYYSRPCDHDTFIRGCRGEFFRRGTENVRDVGAVMDAADWLGQLTEEHCAHAVSILDFNHGSAAVVGAGHAALGEGNADCAAWIGPQLHELRHGEPATVLAAMLALTQESNLSTSAVEAIQRQAQLPCPAHRADPVRQLHPRWLLHRQWDRRKCPTSTSSRRASRAPGCNGRQPVSTLSSPFALPNAATVGLPPGLTLRPVSALNTARCQRLLPRLHRFDQHRLTRLTSKTASLTNAHPYKRFPATGHAKP